MIFVRLRDVSLRGMLYINTVRLLAIVLHNANYFIEELTNR